MKQVVGCFQFFYSSRDGTLPHLDIPTRDVTNTANAGYKTEPLLERRLENWCACRASMVTPRARDALSVTAASGQHYMILTTKRPIDGHEFAVGFLKFSRSAYRTLLKRYPMRWNLKHQPYPGDFRSKLVRFSEAYSLRAWIDARPRRKKYMPGIRCGIVKAPSSLLNDILKHFSALSDRRAEFLANVAHLERQLKRNYPVKIWRNYENRKRGSSKKKCYGCRARKC
jgi:hypothetical protein